MPTPDRSDLRTRRDLLRNVGTGGLGATLIASGAFGGAIAPASIVQAAETSDSLLRVYASRKAFVADPVSGGVGDLVHAGGLFYQAEDGATAIADLPGWVPSGTVCPDHFRDNDGGDMTAAIQAALDYVGNRRTEARALPTDEEYRGRVILKDGVYNTTGSILMTADGLYLGGEGLNATIRRPAGDFYTVVIGRGGLTFPSGSAIYGCMISDVRMVCDSRMTSAGHIHNIASEGTVLKNLYLRNPHIGVMSRGAGNFDYSYVVVEWMAELYDAAPTVGSAGFDFIENRNTYTPGESFSVLNFGTSGSLYRCRTTVRSAVMNGSLRPTEYGFKVQTGDGIWFTDCYARAASLANFGAVPFDAHCRLTGIKYLACWSDWTSGTSFLFAAGGEGHNSANHQISNCRSFGAKLTQHAVRLAGAEGVTISGFISENTQAEGLYVDDGVSKLSIVGSIWDDAKASPDVFIHENTTVFTSDVPVELSGSRPIGARNLLSGTYTYASDGTLADAPETTPNSYRHVLEVSTIPGTNHRVYCDRRFTSDAAEFRSWQGSSTDGGDVVWAVNPAPTPL